jgi:hypothetical protein
LGNLRGRRKVLAVQKDYFRFDIKNVEMAKRKVIFSFDAMCEWETALVLNWDNTYRFGWI